MRLNLFVVGSCLLVAAACSSAAPAGPLDGESFDVARESARIARLVPFKTTVDGITTATGPGHATRCGTDKVEGVKGTGTATTLGRYTFESSHCLVAGSGAVYAGVITFVAANGDRLFGDYYGKKLPTSDPTTFAVEGQFNPTGGAGRFQAAHGNGVLSGEQNVASGKIRLLFDGTVSQPNSTKPDGS